MAIKGTSKKEFPSDILTDVMKSYKDEYLHTGSLPVKSGVGIMGGVSGISFVSDKTSPYGPPPGMPSPFKGPPITYPDLLKPTPSQNSTAPTIPSEAVTALKSIAKSLEALVERFC